MKKTLVNLAISTALLATASAHAATEEPGTDQGVDKTSQYVGIGVGAATGAIVAGPVGLVIGGIVGSLAGQHHDRAEPSEPAVTAKESPGSLADEILISTAPVDTSPADRPADTTVLASTTPPESVSTGDEADHSAVLQNILTTDLSLDVFFRSGGTEVESFYVPRLQAIAAIMREMPQLELHLDGYSDRRGTPEDNLALSNQRLDAVRAQLQQAGIDENRIFSQAHGEDRFVTRPGDLEAYTFDRRVVIRFEQSMPATKSPVASIVDTPVM